MRKIPWRERLSVVWLNFCVPPTVVWRIIEKFYCSPCSIFLSCVMSRFYIQPKKLFIFRFHCKFECHTIAFLFCFFFHDSCFNSPMIWSIISWENHRIFMMIISIEIIHDFFYTWILIEYIIEWTSKTIISLNCQLCIWTFSPNQSYIPYTQRQQPQVKFIYFSLKSIRLSILIQLIRVWREKKIRRISSIIINVLENSLFFFVHFLMINNYCNHQQKYKYKYTAVKWELCVVG